MNKIWVLVLVLLTIAVILGIFFWYSIPDYSPVNNAKEIYFPGVDEHLYVSSEAWGVSYDRQIILVSTKPRTRSEYNQSEDYVYRTTAPIFYRAYDDSLVIYTSHHSPVPEDFGSKVKVEQVVLDDGQFRDLMDEYEERGLIRVSAIDISS